MKRPEDGTKPDTEAKNAEPKEPTPQTGKHPADGRSDPGRISENRKELGVDDEHKTTDMERGHRGTFP